MRAIVSMLNSDGGFLFIGVDDKGEIVGIEEDYNTIQKKNRDGFLLHFDNLINNYIGKEYHQYLNVSVESIEGKDVCVVQIKKSNSPAFVTSKDNNWKEHEEFFIRGIASSHHLGQKKTLDYIKNRWKDRS